MLFNITLILIYAYIIELKTSTHRFTFYGDAYETNPKKSVHCTVAFDLSNEWYLDIENGISDFKRNAKQSTKMRQDPLQLLEDPLHLFTNNNLAFLSCQTKQNIN